MLCGLTLIRCNYLTTRPNNGHCRFLTVGYIALKKPSTYKMLPGSRHQPFILKLGDNSYIATTLVYGQNHFSDNGKTLPSVLLESSLQLNRTAIYGRYEYVQKDADELDLVNTFKTNPNFAINALTLGVNHILSTVKHTDLTGGIQATLNISPSPLVLLYGNTPVGFEVYLR